MAATTSPDFVAALKQEIQASDKALPRHPLVQGIAAGTVASAVGSRARDSADHVLPPAGAGRPKPQSRGFPAAEKR